MNRRKLIYFLSAFVLIIGCYALNLSYSLFTQNIISGNNVVDTTIPVINANLEEDTFTIPANSSEVVKLKINNTGTADIYYGISIDDTKGTIVQLVEGYEIIGSISYSESEQPMSKEVWVYVTNPTGEKITDLTFKLEVKYNTLIFNENEFIASSNFKIKDDGTLDTVKILNGSIIARAMYTITDENKTIYDEEFDSSIITGVSGENERKLIKAEDDYGDSFVFRGAVKDNYVNFAGFTWRIVRINGDESVRLILDGTLDKVIKEGETVAVYKNSALTALEDNDGLVYFNSTNNDNAYVGYMYGTFTTKSTSYDEAHRNDNSSSIKTYIDTFYEEYLTSSYYDSENELITNESNKDANGNGYEQYLADTMFCGDKSLASSGIGGVTTQLGYGNNKTYYAATERLWYSGGSTYVNSEKPATPTLKCAEGESNTYSRYTMNGATTDKGIETNGDLKHPIALLSADELVLAGAWGGDGTKVNKSYYLYDNYENGLLSAWWWTLTPGYYGSFLNALGSVPGGNSLDYLYTGYEHGVRPVINIKANLLLESGDGTQSNPYVLEEIVG